MTPDPANWEIVKSAGQVWDSLPWSEAGDWAGLDAAQSGPTRHMLAVGQVGRHRGIVGEAGTEVGITRSALRELSSAGIPGYANGTYFGKSDKKPSRTTSSPRQCWRPGRSRAKVIKVS